MIIENQNRERFTNIKSSFLEKNNELTRLMIQKQMKLYKEIYNFKGHKGIYNYKCTRS